MNHILVKATKREVVLVITTYGTDSFTLQSYLTMLRILVLCSVLSLFFILKVDGLRGGSRWARGLTRIQNNILKRADPIRMLQTGSSLTSVYVGSTGIWWRSSVIAAISQMEQGEKEKAMETLNIAITTLAVFDTTQAAVSPIASELIDQLVKHKGKFSNTIKGFTEYNRAVAERVVSGNADDVDDIIDNAKSLKKRIGEFFDSEAEAFIKNMKNTQGYDDLVTSLNNAKKWARGLKWFDTISGPLFDAANVAFCGWQLHNAIHDEDSPPEVRSLNIASASMGVASGAVGVTAFVVGALATTGSTLAAVAGPVGAIIGCLLSLASIIIDFINSVNPYGTIKNHLETIQKLKEGSLQYLENQVDITQQITSVFKQNAGFDTIYEINQGNLIVGLRDEQFLSVKGVDKDKNIIFNAKIRPGQEDGYLTMGKNRIFDNSKYGNFFFRPTGKVSLGYDFYGKAPKRNGKGVTVVANTAMVAEQFWIRGVHIDTRVENDNEAQNPDNVVIGETTGLADSDHLIRVYTGAGDDLLQVTGLLCNPSQHESCFVGKLGTGIDTLSFQGMDTNRVEFPGGRKPKIFVGIKFDMRDTGIHGSSKIYLRLKDSESSPVNEYGIGDVQSVDVFHGTY